MEIRTPVDAEGFVWWHLVVSNTTSIMVALLKRGKADFHIFLLLSMAFWYASGTQCPEVTYQFQRDSTTQTLNDFKYVSESQKSIAAASILQCIQKCLAECLCYFANYKIQENGTVSCDLVKYPRCSERSGVGVIHATGWVAVKLIKETKTLESFDNCCQPRELEKLLAKFCEPVCTTFVVRRANFGPGDGAYRWRCFSGDTLTIDGYYYNGGTKFCTRDNDIYSLKTIVDSYPAIASAEYKLGEDGESCGSVCANLGKICSPNLLMLNTVYHFHRLGFPCQYNQNQLDCFSSNIHPIFFPASMRCNGFINVPQSYDCATGAQPGGRRLCKCVDPGP